MAGGRDVLESRPITPSSFAFPKALGTPRVLFEPATEAHLPGCPYLVTEGRDARKQSKAAGHTGHAQHERKVGFLPEKGFPAPEPEQF